MSLKKLKNIKDPSISKEKYKWSDRVVSKLDYDRWVEYIENHSAYFIWLENTEDGRKTLAELDKIPESFRQGILKGHNKLRALAEYNTKKGWYEIVISFHEDFGIIHTTFMKKLTKEHLRMLLDMATYLDAYLLNNGKIIIDEKIIEELE